MKRKLRMLGMDTPLGVCLIAACSSVALTALVVVTFATRTVLADVRLSQSVVAISGAPLTPSLESARRAEASQQAAVVAAKAEQAAIKRGDRLHGIASWYGGVFNGRKTASGERYDMYAMTACHPTLPFGSLVKVINHRNHRSVVVKITDRGDLVEQNRIIDLSFGAAQRLAMAKSGLAKVDLQVLTLGPSRR
jgi:rare lipoprotein A (peptidoglycan hydrolase)